MKLSSRISFQRGCTIFFFGRQGEAALLHLAEKSIKCDSLKTKLNYIEKFTIQAMTIIPIRVSGKPTHSSTAAMVCPELTKGC